MVKVSIIIPVWNQEKLILRCLDSIPKRNDIEIICVDDCSTDHTLEVLKAYGGIKIYKNITNSGSGVTRNVGIENASGEYVLFLDSDDYLDSNVFNTIVDNYLKDDLVFYNLRANNGGVWKAWQNGNVDLCGTVKFIKRDFLNDIRYPTVRVAEDYWFNKALLSRNPSMTNTELVMLNYNWPREGSNEFNRLNHLYSQEVYDSIDDILIEYKKRYNL